MYLLLSRDLRFEGHENTKQMVGLKYFFDHPIENGGLKHVWISTLNNGCQSCFVLRTLVVDFEYLSVIVALK